jgi:hypothetical protein
MFLLSLRPPRSEQRLIEATSNFGVEEEAD